MLALFDVGRRARLRLLRVSVHLDDPRGAWERIQLAFPGRARAGASRPANPGPGRLVMETVLGETMDASTVLRLLADTQIAGIHTVTVDEGKMGPAADMRRGAGVRGNWGHRKENEHAFLGEDRFLSPRWRR